MPDITTSPRSPSPQRGGRSAGFRWRILVWIAVVALGPLFIMAGQGYHCARHAIIESQETHLRSVIETRRERLESQLAERRADLDFLALRAVPYLVIGASAPAPRLEFERESREFLGMLEDRRPSFRSVMLFDNVWNCAAETEDEPCNADRLPPGFRADLETRDAFSVGPPRVEPGGVLVFPAGLPVTDMRGERLGFIVAELGLSTAVDPVLRDRTGLGETGVISLVSPDGTYLAAPGGDESLIGTAAPLPGELLSPENVVVREYKTRNATPVIGASAFVPELGWFLVAEVEGAEAFEWLVRLQMRALVTGLVTIVLVLIVSVMISERLSRPLRELARVARRVGRGSHNERVQRLEGPEARDVAQAFNTMLDELAAAQRRLVQTASLAAVGQLSSSIVHEMRNPLSSVKMNLQALKKKVEGDMAYSELADIALGQATRLEKMASDLLGYGKPLRLEPSRIRFSELAAEVESTVPGNGGGKNVRLEVSTKDGDPEFSADREQLRQALTNLVLNAVQASPDGGKVTLSARSIPFDGGRVEIEVADEGPGLPEGAGDRLFQPFYTTRPGGTGLGLANVRKIAEYHNGSVTAEDRPGGGAVFTIRLPREGRSS